MIDVKEVIGVEEDMNVDTMVTERRASASGALARLELLKRCLDNLSENVNMTNVNNTEESWHLAYARLTKAFKECMKEESAILVKES